MNRNNFFIHLALALVLILVAAFAGQLSRWRKEWRSRVHIVPTAEKKQAATSDEIALSETRNFGSPEVLVKFKSGVSDEAIEALTARLHDRVEDRIENADGVEAIDDLDNADASSIVAEYSKLPEVEYAEPNYEIKLDETVSRVDPVLPHDPQFEDQWALSNSGQRGGKQGADISATLAWTKTTGSEDVVVAVLDTGVAYRNGVLRRDVPSWRDFFGSNLVTYPALGTVDIPFAAAPDLAGPNRFVAPRDFIWNDTDPLDFDGHGTHVAGTIGQLTNNGIGVAGMAFNVRIMPVKVIDSMWDDILGSPFEGTDDVVARGVRYAVDNGAKVLNMSIGRSGAPSPLLQEAIIYATSHGAFVSIAAGNDFERGNPAQWPAAYAPAIQGAVAVAATGRDRQRAYYSSTGSFVELAAPGGNQRTGGTTGGIVQQTYDFAFVDTFANGPTRYGPPRFDIFSYQFLQGTSMSTPHVAGFAALLMQQGITSPAAVEAAMEQFATDLGTPGVDQQYGHGLINPRASLRGLGLAK